MSELNDLLILIALLLLAFQTLYLTFCVARINQSFKELEKITGRILARLSLQTDQIVRISNDTKDLSNHRGIMEHNMATLCRSANQKTQRYIDLNTLKKDLMQQFNEDISAWGHDILKEIKKGNKDQQEIKTRLTASRKRELKTLKK